MGVNAILFGDCSGIDATATPFGSYFRNPIKSSAILRLGHYLRRRGHAVLQVHHFTSFLSEEIRQLVLAHVTEETKLIGFSSSFLVPLQLTISNERYNDAINEDTFNLIKIVCETAKTINPKIKLVIGGFMVFAERFTKLEDFNSHRFNQLSTLIDYFVEGPGEIVCDLILSGKIPAFSTINGAKLIDGDLYKVRDFSENGTSPAPVIDGISQNENMFLELANGCIFNCEFCHSSRNLGKKLSEFNRDYESIKSEVIYNYQQFGSSVYLFLDEMVNDNPQKAEWLIKIREETGIQIKWTGYIRLDTITSREQFERLKLSGCCGMFLGIESLKKEVGPKIGKCTDPDKIIPKLKMLREVFGDSVYVQVAMIAGLPGETQEEFKETIKWMNSPEGKHLIDRITMAPLSVYNFDKGEISKRRKNPFDDYILDAEWQKKYSSPANWTSPWGTRKEFIDLVNTLFNETKNSGYLTHAFYLVMYHNIGIDIDQFIFNLRNHNTQSLVNYKEVFDKSQLIISEYRKLVLSLTSSQIDDAHSVFWQYFPILTR